MESAAVKILLCDSWYIHMCISVRYVPRSGFAGSQGACMFSEEVLPTYDLTGSV